MRRRPAVFCAVALAAILVSACAGTGATPFTGGLPGDRAAGPTQQPVAATSTISPYVLPDLQVEPPYDLYISPDEVTGERELRFSTTVVNAGPGDLDMVGEYDPERDHTRATQHLTTTTGGTGERVAGYFIFHPDHDHWHFEDFTVIELWTYDDGGELLEMVESSGKLSFCIIDSQPMDYPPPEAPKLPTLAECDPVSQGISAGWEDVYASELPN